MAKSLKILFLNLFAKIGAILYIDRTLAKIKL